MDITDQLDEIIKNIPAPRGYGKPLVKLQYSGDKLDFHVSFTKTRKLKGGVTHDVDSVVQYTAKSVSPQDISGSKLSSRKIVKEIKHPVSSESKKHKCPSRFRRDKMRWEERKRQRIKTKSDRKKESQSRFFSHSSSVPHELFDKSANHVESMPEPPIVSAPKPKCPGKARIDRSTLDTRSDGLSTDASMSPLLAGSIDVPSELPGAVVSKSLYSLYDEIINSPAHAPKDPPETSGDILAKKKDNLWRDSDDDLFARDSDDDLFAKS